ncbi:putative cytochrome P450 [Durotheca rogersii]|uniref:putative cytochrome P450 n=1 Tax=Durotheca rogersii TaxID=419775 RepID=UPI00221F597E|nr:putative cytochrome P450 [Durotheca rogersii]KAI5860389.1 putative cytochrome P450 [Durotheca rogersii]
MDGLYRVAGGIENHQLVALALCAALLAYVYTVLSSPLAKIPGPWYTKWTTAVLKYNMIKGRRPKWVHSLHEKYGPLVRIGPAEVSVQDPEAVQQMYAIKGEFLKGRFYKDLLPGEFENVFSTADVDYHRRLRRLLAAEFSESGLAVHRPAVDAKVQLTIQRMAEEMEERGVVDVYRWFLYMATDVIGELSFGSSFQMLETKEENQYIRDLKLVGFAGGVRSTFPFLTWVNKFVPLPVLSVGTSVRERMRGYASESLARHYRLAAGGEGAGAGAARPTLLSKLYRAAGEDALSFGELRESATVYITAGSDTTTNTLTYLVWAVCARPDVRARLLAELRALPPAFEDPDLRRLPYLDRLLTETLRLFSAAPAGLPRRVPPAGARLAGRWLPPGCTVSAQAYSMHRDPAVYPDPLRFDPDRWENPTRAMKDAFVPFGGGSRICIGLHLAKMELRLATARFFTRFPNAKISTKEGFCDEDMEADMYFLMSPKKHRCLIEVY